MTARGGREPQRTCIGCRRVRSKSELVRLVLDGETVAIDRSKAMPGRGAYVCPEGDCFKKAARKSGTALRSGGARRVKTSKEQAKNR